MRTFKEYKDVELFADTLIRQGTHKKELKKFVEHKIKEGILCPEKLTVHVFSLLHDFKLN